MSFDPHMYILSTTLHKNNQSITVDELNSRKHPRKEKRRNYEKYEYYALPLSARKAILIAFSLPEIYWLC